MTGPDLISADGARRALTWRRLRRSAEVNVAVPLPPWPPTPRRRPSLYVEGMRIEANAKWINPLRESLATDAELPEDTTAPPWSPAQWEEMETAAIEVLRKHDYPMTGDLILWRWLPQGLYWTQHPGFAGQLDGEDLPLKFLDPLSLSHDLDPRFEEGWPIASAFRWAERVYRLARQYRAACIRLEEGDKEDRVVGAFDVFEAGYLLGLGIGSAEALARLEAAQVEAVKRAKSDQAIANGGKGNATQEAERRVRRAHWVSMVPEFYNPTTPTLRPWTLDRLAGLIFEEQRLPPHPEDWNKRGPAERDKWTARNLGTREQIRDYLQRAIENGEQGTEAFKDLPLR